MLGASSSEEEDDDYYNYASTDRDDVSETLVQPVPTSVANRKTSFRSIRSVSPTESDGVSVCGSIKTATGNGFPGAHRAGGGFRQTDGHAISPASAAVAHHRTTSQTGSLSPTPSMRSLSTLSEKRAVNEASTPEAVTPRVSKEEEERMKAEEEEEERKKRLQLYVFVARCIAYHFNAKQPTDMARRQTKVTKHELNRIRERFQAFLRGETQIAADEAFTNAVK